MYLTNAWEYLLIACVIHEKRCTRTLKLKQKSDFLIKNLCIWPLVQWWLFKKDQGDKGAEVAKYFRRNTCTQKLLGNICQLHVFFKRKRTQECLGSSKKQFSYLKIMYLAIGFTTSAKNLPT